MPVLRFIAVPLAVAALLSMFSVSAPAAERRVALVIGNSEYQFTNPLRNPRNDADDLALALGPLGFDVVIKGVDLTERAFADKLREFARAAHGADVTLLFYAGHGVQVDGENYLIPVDAEIRDELDLRRRTFELTTFLNEMRGRTNLVFLDACRDNPQVRSLVRSLGAQRSAAVTRGLSPVEIPSGSGALIAFATQPGNVAEDGHGRNSPFTEALLAHIATPGQSVTDMLMKVRQEVMTSTRQQQVPWTSESLLTQFFFKPEVPPDPPSPPTQVVASAVEPPLGGSETEQQYEKERMAEMAYRTADSLESVELFEEVVTRYSGTIHAKAAEEQIRRLEEAKALAPAAGSAPATSEQVPVTVDSPALHPRAPTPAQTERSLELTRAERRWIQNALASSGFAPGKVDGMFGENTRQAIRRYQAGNGRPAEGYLTVDEARELIELGTEVERRHRQEEQQRAEAERLRVAAANRQAEAERRRIDEEKNRAEAERRRVAAAKKQAETERRRLEAAEKQAEAERIRIASAEKQVEAERRGIDEEKKRAEAERIRIAAAEKQAEAARERWAKQSGADIRDCPDCPQMVVMPLGAYSMGSPSKERGRKKTEGPVHQVTIQSPFAAGKFEVTRRQFRRFVDETGYSESDGCRTFGSDGWKRRDGKSWLEPGYAQTDDHPVVCVSWEDAKAYVEWLSTKTGKRYRLLSESEWEYAARGGTQTARYWGDRPSEACKYANVVDRSHRKEYSQQKSAIHRCDDGYAATSPVGSRAMNEFGLYDMLGNVWEFVEDCWHAGYSESSADGSARNRAGDCSRRVVRGGSWGSTRDYVRSAVRVRVGGGSRFSDGGFRVARTLE